MKNKVTFFILFLICGVVLGQVFLPLTFWSGGSATLVISDAVTYNYGSIGISIATDKTFTVSNTGSLIATSMSASAFTNSSVYSFKGGSYPGTGGTCSTDLAMGSSCTIVVTANNYNSNAGSTITVNLTTSGSNIYYSDSGCGTVITSTTITSGTYTRTVYTQNATIQTATVTATDNAAVLLASSKAVNFNSSLTWWNGSWVRRIRIDINNTDQATSFTNQPVLIKIDSSIITYADIQANGADIRFVASDDTTSLNYEFDSWNYNGTSEIWVRVPSITASSSAGYIYMYYKNPTAVDAQNRTGVWTNYWSVWHLGEDPTSTAPQYTDSTGSGRNGTALNSPSRASGKIGYAADLNGASDAVDINSNLSTALGVSTTFSCWMRTSQTGNNTSWLAPGLTGVEQSGGGNDIFFGWIDGGGLIGITAGNGAAAKSAFVVNNNAWRHVTITRNSTSGAVVFYINGVASGSGTSETGSKTTYFDLLGEIGDTGGSPVNYNGLIDEVRIYNSLQAAPQVLADFKFMSNTNLIYGLVETGP